MKKALVLSLAMLAVLIAVPAFAEDGNVSQDTLSSLGLGDLQGMSDADGMEIRGRQSGNGMVVGTSLIAGQLVTPDTKNFITFSSINMVSGDFMTLTSGISSVTKTHGVGINPAITLNVTFPDGTMYMGSAFGTIGGTGQIVVSLP